MQNLFSELARLYLPAGASAPQALAQHLLGQTSIAFRLSDGDGQVRALVIPFIRQPGDDADQHWTRLCTVANALQAELGLPAPAVSISGGDGYRLWLSLETPVPVAEANEFLRLLRQAYFPEVEHGVNAISESVELPPCRNRDTGKWAAFIHPGMGASFAEDAGLDMAPPLGSQVGFLEGLQSIGVRQFMHALDVLRQSPDAVPEPPATVRAPDGNFESLLLKDATLEDIVRFLHSKDIEPTFRHLLPQSR